MAPGTAAEKRRFVPNLLFGVFLGLICSFSLRLLMGSSAALGQFNSAGYDHALGATPLVLPARITSDGETTTTMIPSNIKTSNIETPFQGSRLTKPETVKPPPLGKDEPAVVVGRTATVASDNTIQTTTKAATERVVKEFERQEGVAIVTKIHSTNHFQALEQSLCLLQKAYNNRVLYDIIVFSSEKVNETEVESIRKTVAPAKITFVVDNPGLQNRLAALPEAGQKDILQRCNATSLKQINWYTYCTEKDVKFPERLSYTWQAEFRALHIWTHPALADYKYMMWLDTDGFCTRVWNRDPVAFMIQNDLVLFFDHFNAGSSRGPGWQQRYVAAFGRTLCSIKMVNGRLANDMGRNCPQPSITQVHGFFHITNLEFYRSEPVMKWNRILIGDTIFSRRFDDQIGVTVPAAVLAPERSWEMEESGLKLDVFHNFKLDGKYQVGGFIRWWSEYGKSNFTEAFGICPANNRGR